MLRERRFKSWKVLSFYVFDPEAKFLCDEITVAHVVPCTFVVLQVSISHGTDQNLS